MPKADAKYRITADDQTARGLRSARRRLSLFAAGLAGVAVGALTNFRALFAFIERGLTDSIKRLDKFAKAGVEIGASAAEVREIDFAADALGVTLDKVVKTVDRLNKSLGEDSKEYQDAWKQLGVDPRTIASIEDTSDRIVAVGDALEQLQKKRGLAVRETVEQALLGRDVSKLFVDGGRQFAALVEQANVDGLIEGTNEAAAAAERAADAWTRAGKIWAKLFEQSGFFSAAEKAGNVLANVGQAARGRGADEPAPNRTLRETIERNTPLALLTRLADVFSTAAQPSTPQVQAGGFVPQSVPENLDRAARKTNISADALNRATSALERTLNRYQ